MSCFSIARLWPVKGLHASRAGSAFFTGMIDPRLKPRVYLEGKAKAGHPPGEEWQPKKAKSRDNTGAKRQRQKRWGLKDPRGCG